MYVFWFFYDLFAPKPKLSTLLPFRKKKKEKGRNYSAFNWVLSFLAESMNASPYFHVPCSICHQISTNGLINFSTLPHKATTPHNSSVRSDEGLTLEMPIFHGGNSTFINSFDATQFLKFSGLSRCCLSNDNKMR